MTIACSECGCVDDALRLQRQYRQRLGFKRRGAVHKNTCFACLFKDSGGLLDDRSFDPIHRPAHYAEGRKYEPIDVIVDWRLDFLLGNVVKYVSRAGRKPDASELQDLEKAAFYLRKAVERARERENT